LKGALPGAFETTWRNPRSINVSKVTPSRVAMSRALRSNKSEISIVIFM
jgi:hypothetical protein